MYLKECCQNKSLKSNTQETSEGERESVLLCETWIHKRLEEWKYNSALLWGKQDK